MASEAPETNEAAPLGTPGAPSSQTNVNSATQPTTQPAPEQDAAAVAPAAEPRMPTRKDVSLRELLNKIDDYAPIVRYSLPSSLAFLTLQPELIISFFLFDRSPTPSHTTT